MGDNPHFLAADSWKEAEALVTFRPLRPARTAGFELTRLSVFARDHRMRELAPADRSLEAHYGGFVLSQARKPDGGARRAALSTSYGIGGYEVSITGRAGRGYELGAEVPADDIDGRSPAVIAWYEDDMFYFLASTELTAAALVDIAMSLHEPTSVDAAPDPTGP